MRTDDLGEELSQNTDQLVVDKLTALDAGLFQSLDLLLDDHLKGTRSDKECLQVTLSAGLNEQQRGFTHGR